MVVVVVSELKPKLEKYFKIVWDGFNHLLELCTWTFMKKVNVENSMKSFLWDVGARKDTFKLSG